MAMPKPGQIVTGKVRADHLHTRPLIVVEVGDTRAGVLSCTHYALSHNVGRPNLPLTDWHLSGFETPSYLWVKDAAGTLAMQYVPFGLLTDRRIGLVTRSDGERIAAALKVPLPPYVLQPFLDGCLTVEEDDLIEHLLKPATAGTTRRRPGGKTRMSRHEARRAFEEEDLRLALDELAEDDPQENPAVPPKKPLTLAPPETSLADCPDFIDKTFGQPIGGGLRAEVVLISPETAEALLEKQGGLNRKLREDRVERYAREMIAGKWEVHAAIGFDSNNVLWDGQHRLNAVVRANVTVPMLVVWGHKPQRAQITADQNMTRTFGQNLGFWGFRYVSDLAATVSMCMAFGNGFGSFVLSRGSNASPSEKAEWLANNIHIYSDGSAKWSEGQQAPSNHDAYNRIAKWKQRVDISASIVGASWWLLAKAGGPERASLFWEKVTDNDPTSFSGPNDPLWQLQRILKEQKTLKASRTSSKRPYEPIHLLALTVDAWNKWLSGSERKLFFRAADMAFPTPLVPDTLEPAKAA